MEHSDLPVLLAIEKLAGFNLTQDQLGELCGLSRDTFTGTLVRLKKKGLIESSSGHIRCLKKTDLTISPECFNRVSPCFKLLSESCPLTERLGKDVLSKLCDETRYDGSMWKFDIFFNFAVDILSRLEIAPSITRNWPPSSVRRCTLNRCLHSIFCDIWRSQAYWKKRSWPLIDFRIPICLLFWISRPKSTG